MKLKTSYFLFFILLVVLSNCKDKTEPGEDALVFLDKTTSERTADACTEQCHAPASFMDPIGRNGEKTAGKHKKHVGERGYACYKCHFEYDQVTTHRDGILDTPDSGVNIIFFDPSRNPIGKWVNDTGLDENGIKTGGCADLYCHGGVKEPNWYEDTHLICTDCHTPGSPFIDPLTTSDKSGKGKHTRHAGEMKIDCQRCHENYPKRSSHANGEFGHSGIKAENHYGSEIPVEDENYIFFGGVFRDKNVDADFGDSGTGSCDNIVCHGGQSGFNWYTEGESCVACHRPGEGSPIDPVMLNGTGTNGKHMRHVLRRGIECTMCHKGYKEKPTHMNGTFNADDPAIVLINFDDDYYPDGEWVDDDGSALGKKGGCIKICHDDARDVSSDYNVSWYAEINDNFKCINCHNTGSHLTHLVKNYGPKISCGADGWGYGCHGIAPFDASADLGFERMIRQGDANFYLKPNPADPPKFADGKHLTETTYCNNCHSSGGDYDGANDPTMGSKYNWYDGVYLTGTDEDYDASGDQTVLKAGKEKWCAGCHDSPSSFIQTKEIPSGIQAPPVAGDKTATTNFGTGWGFFESGHGVPTNQRMPWTGNAAGDASWDRPGPGLACIKCHDPTLPHIDGDQRTFNCTELDDRPACTSTDYFQSYRLRKVGGDVPLDIPVPVGSFDTTSAKLCFQCHDSDRFLTTAMDTNFTLDPGMLGPGNSHRGHLMGLIGSVDTFHADWDITGNTARSNTHCVTCHNPHGSTQHAMIRDGKLNGGRSLKILYKSATYGSTPVADPTGQCQSPDPVGTPLNIRLGDSDGFYFCGLPDFGSGSGVCARSCHGSLWGAAIKEIPRIPKALLTPKVPYP